MVEVKTYNQWPNTVFIDGELLPRQLMLPAIVSKDMVIVEIMTDVRVEGCPDPNKIPYQVRPYERFMHTNKKGMTVNATRFVPEVPGQARCSVQHTTPSPLYDPHIQALRS